MSESTIVKAPTPKPGDAGLPVNDVPFDAPWQWLADGWSDLWQVWPLSLAYGTIFAVAALALLVGLSLQGAQAVIMSLAAGFLLLGPMLAIGLYEASRRLGAGEPVEAKKIIFMRTASPMQLVYLGLVLMMLFLFWIRVATLLFALFFSQQAFPPLTELIPTLLLTSHGIGLLVVGTVVGAVLAITAFALSAVSVPLLVAHDVDFITAVATSIKSLVQNPQAMLLWAGLIAALMVLGMVTMFIGMIVIFPLIGHATWHAFQDVVETDN